MEPTPPHLTAAVYVPDDLPHARQLCNELAVPVNELLDPQGDPCPACAELLTDATSPGASRWRPDQ